MKKAAALGMSLSEETLTEYVLYNIAVAHAGSKIIINLATKQEEKKHGADWEWWLIHKSKGIGFRVQAKRLFPSGRYQSLFDKKKDAKPYDQLDKLVDASQKKKRVPLYCFYNFPVTKGQLNAKKGQCGHGYRGPSFWGCSLAFPEDVKEKKSDELAKLEPIMIPWHRLVCKSSRTDMVSAVRAFLREAGRRDEETAPRQLPPYVTRLIELADQTRESEYPTFWGDEYWSIGGGPEDISGIVLLRDLRAL
jgi:hypothetical protein